MNILNSYVNNLDLYKSQLLYYAEKLKIINIIKNAFSDKFKHLKRINEQGCKIYNSTV